MFIGFMTKEVIDVMRDEKSLQAEQQEHEAKAKSRGAIIGKAADMIMRVTDQKAQLDYQRLMMEENRKKIEAERSKKVEKSKDDDYADDVIIAPIDNDMDDGFEMD